MPHLEGQGDLVTRLIMEMIGVTIWVIRVINLLTKSPLTLQADGPGFAHSGFGTEEYLSVLRQHATSKDLFEHGKWAASHNRGTLGAERRWGL